MWLFASVTFNMCGKICTFAVAKKNMGKSCTTSSLGILQDGNVAKVLGCSGAM